MLPHVMRFNLVNAANDYAAIASDAFPELTATPRSERAEAMIQALTSLIGAIGLPTTLQAVGVSEDDLSDMAVEAMQQTRLLINNPRPVTQADAFDIYRAALR